MDQCLLLLRASCMGVLGNSYMEQPRMEQLCLDLIVAPQADDYFGKVSDRQMISDQFLAMQQC